MKIKPLFDRVLIVPVEAKKKESTIIIPDTIKDAPDIAKVVAIGKYEEENKQFSVKIGDRVLFNKYATNEYQLDNETFFLIKEIDILGIIETNEED